MKNNNIFRIRYIYPFELRWMKFKERAIKFLKKSGGGKNG